MTRRKKFNFFAKLLRRWYWIFALALVTLVSVGVSLAMLPTRDANDSFATRPYGLMTTLENRALDLLFQARDVWRKDERTRGVREPVTIIEIDDATLSATGVRFQKTQRTSYARLIDRASIGGAAVIAVDDFLSEAGGTSAEDVAADENLAQSITNAGNVVIAKKLEAGGTPAINPLPMFADVAYGVGYADLPSDTDSVRAIRSTLIAKSAEDMSFGARIAEAYLIGQHIAEGNEIDSFQGLERLDETRVRFGKREIPLRIDGNLQLDFRARSPSFTHVSANDILAPDAAPLSDELFRDRIILIGASYTQAPDLFETPFIEPFQVMRFFDRDLPTTPKLMPGVEIHATALATMLWGNAPARPAYWLQAALVILSIMLVAAAVFTLRVLPGALVVALLAAGFFVCAAWMFTRYATVLPLASAWLGMVVMTPVGLGLRYAHERAVREEKEAERAEIMDIFSRCVSDDVAEKLWQQRDALAGGERRIVTIIFTDIRGFTTISEKIPSDKLVEMLNDYFSRMHLIVDRHCGHINKFIGDGLMIVFGAPVSRGDYGEAWAAVACGLEMLQEVEVMNGEAAKHNRPEIKIGVGIHTGEAICGIVGAERRLEYTVIGDTVNLSARLESTTKEYQVPILISAATHELINKRYETQALGEVTVKGKTKSTKVYTVIERRKKRRLLTDTFRRESATPPPNVAATEVQSTGA